MVVVLIFIVKENPDKVDAEIVETLANTITVMDKLTAIIVVVGDQDLGYGYVIVANLNTKNQKFITAI